MVKKEVEKGKISQKREAEEVQEKESEKANNKQFKREIQQDDSGDESTDEINEFENLDALSFYEKLIKRLEGENSSIFWFQEELNEDDKADGIQLFEKWLELFQSEQNKKSCIINLKNIAVLQFSMLLGNNEKLIEFEKQDNGKNGQIFEEIIFDLVVKLWKIIFSLRDYCNSTFPGFGIYSQGEEKIEDNAEKYKDKLIIPETVEKLKKEYVTSLEKLKSFLYSNNNFKFEQNSYRILGCWIVGFKTILKIQILKKFKLKWIKDLFQLSIRPFDLIIAKEGAPFNQDVIKLYALLYNLYDFFSKFMDPSILKSLIEIILIGLESHYESIKNDFEPLNLLGQSYLIHANLLEKTLAGDSKEEEMAQSFAMGIGFLEDALVLQPNNLELKLLLEGLAENGTTMDDK